MLSGRNIFLSSLLATAAVEAEIHYGRTLFAKHEFSVWKLN